MSREKRGDSHELFPGTQTGGISLKSILMLMPFFGKWPEWINLFIESCKWNPSIDWLFFTDCGEPGNICENVRYIHMGLEEFSALASRKLGIKVDLEKPYKLCDFKPTYGMILGDYLEGKDYWGFGDIDVVYGNIRKFLTDDMLTHDVISFNDRHISGHFCLLRNRKSVKTAFRKVRLWESKLTSKEHANFPEGKEYVKVVKNKYLLESYNTPFSPLIPWTDNTFSFPREWYWKDGSLTNDKDVGKEFLYLHFMHWKGGEWPRKCGNARWEQLKCLVHFDQSEVSEGFIINERGFFKLTNE